jgi:hypothetical protein
MSRRKWIIALVIVFVIALGVAVDIHNKVEADRAKLDSLHQQQHRVYDTNCKPPVQVQAMIDACDQVRRDLIAEGQTP